MRLAKIILISTDWVFDGTQTGADETTPPNPVNYYGVLKVACERVVAERGANWAVARVAGVNGVHWLRRDERQPQNPGYGHFATAVVQSLQRGEPFTVWLGDNINQRASPSLASDSAEMILKIAGLDKQGIFHCSGGEDIERFDLAQRVAQVFGFDPARVQKGAPTGDLPQGARIPDDTSLSASYTAHELDHPLLDMQTLLSRFKREMDTGTI
jgi:dTDP-4-dehydrorhamnose reductase